MVKRFKKYSKRRISTVMYGRRKFGTNIYSVSRRDRVSRGVYRGSNAPYYIKRTTDIPGGNANINIRNAISPGLNPYSFAFTLNDLPNAAEFQALFDNYQISCVVLKLIPVKNQLNTDAIGAFEVPRLHIVYDYDDATLPSTVDQLRQYSTYRVYDANKPITLKVYPKVSIAAYNGVIATGYLSPSAKLQKMFKMDCAYPLIEHYGIKMILEDTGSNPNPNAFIYKCSATYYLKMSGLI